MCRTIVGKSQPQTEYIYAICCRPEVDGDVISGRNVNTVKATLRHIFEDARSSSFGDIKNIS